jgi:hypothetical protein
MKTTSVISPTGPQDADEATAQSTAPAGDGRLGVELAHAIAAQDAGVLRALIATPVTFRAVTPSRCWDAETAVGVAEVILGVWFGPDKQVREISSLTTDRVGDVEKVTYRFRVDLAAGPTVIEQSVYYTEADGQIIDLRLVCSGFRPV